MEGSPPLDFEVRVGGPQRQREQGEQRGWGFQTRCEEGKREGLGHLVVQGAGCLVPGGREGCNFSCGGFMARPHRGAARGWETKDSRPPRRQRVPERWPEQPLLFGGTIPAFPSDRGAPLPLAALTPLCLRGVVMIRQSQW